MKILVIAVHPDDETIGCGGTIAKHVYSKDEVYLLVVTKIHAPEWNMSEFEQRKNEVFKSAKILGIKKVYFGELPTAQLNTIPTSLLNKKIKKVVDKIRPEIVYLPPKGDINLDHDIIFKSSLVVCRPLFDCSIRKILCYEIITTTQYNAPFSENYFIPNYYVDISKFMSQKILAMKQYKLELRKYPHPRSIKGLDLMNRYRGISIGVKYAESFVIIRSIEK